MSEKVANAAEKIANDEVIMDSYIAFFKGKGYFLTKNSELFGAKRKPLKFPATSATLHPTQLRPQTTTPT
jgi:hypothetical protein